jgi:predicted membrane channel-forming protein YqfA (hemolysin III family)
MIPDEFHNLPVHALAVHGAVVLVPLSVLLALLFVFPRTRHWAALPMAIVAVVALVNVYVAKVSGGHLRDALSALSGDPKAWASSPVGKAIKDHQDKANWLFILMIVFAVIAVLVYVLYRQSDRFTGPLEYVACGVLVVAALVVAFQTYRVGEAGSKAVWNPDGNIDYSSSSPLGQRPSVGG